MVYTKVVKDGFSRYRVQMYHASTKVGAQRVNQGGTANQMQAFIRPWQNFPSVKDFLFTELNSYDLTYKTMA